MVDNYHWRQDEPLRVQAFFGVYRWLRFLYTRIAEATEAFVPEKVTRCADLGREKVESSQQRGSRQTTKTTAASEEQTSAQHSLFPGSGEMDRWTSEDEVSGEDDGAASAEG